jgi:hypothetical protein
VVYANSDGGPLRVGLTCANAIIAALESAGYQITRQRAVLQRESLWDDEILMTICGAMQDCDVIKARPGDNILPNAKRFREYMEQHGYRIVPVEQRAGVVEISVASARFLQVLADAELDEQRPGIITDDETYHRLIATATELDNALIARVTGDGEKETP